MTGDPARPTGVEQWEAWTDRRLPDVEQIRPGVWSIAVPIPDHPLRYTLAYAFVSGSETLVLDPGWGSDEGWDALASGLVRAGSDPRATTGVIATHFHADHLGLGARLVQASGAWLALGVEEHPHTLVEDFVGLGRRKFSTWGVPRSLMAEIAPGEAVLHTIEQLAVADRFLSHGEVIEMAGGRLRVIATPGHSPGHICLVDDDRRLIFTGDHVLPRISSTVPFDHLGLDDPVADYLESLTAVQLGDDLEVCPAHEYRFDSIAERCRTLRLHTVARTEEVRCALSTGRCKTVWDVARELSWSRGWESLTGISMRLALAETASHLRYVESRRESTGISLGASPATKTEASARRRERA